MKKVTRKATILVLAVAMCCILCAGVAGCSPSTATDNKGDATAAVSGDCTWTTGDYTSDGSVLTLASGDEVNAREHCLTCHGDAATAQSFDWSLIVKSTADYQGNEGFNPHDSHLEMVSCVACHEDNGAQTILCESCHEL